MSSTAIRGARTLFLAGLAALLAVATAQAQTPTPEGTEITNIAVVNYTDANSNTYAPDSASVTVTIGFVPGLTLAPHNDAQNPAPGQTWTNMPFTITNIGNGIDQVQLTETITDADAVIDTIRFNWNSTDYATLALLNADLVSHDISAGDSIIVTVQYQIKDGVGGLGPATYHLKAESQRDNPATFDEGEYVLTISETFGVIVTRVGSSPLTPLPGDYTQDFKVKNTGDGQEDFDLTASVFDGAITINTVNGVGGSTTSISLAAGDSLTIPVEYTVEMVAAGTQDTLWLEAQSQTDGPTVDDDFVALTVIRPEVTITKEAFWSCNSTGCSNPVGTDSVMPGDHVFYKVTVHNAAGATSANALSVVVDDDLPTQVTYVGHSHILYTVWNFTKTDGPPEHMNAVLTVTLTPDLSRSFYIEVTIN